jgi:ubiquinone/menaquinone biosynthesis C-methylase UbiE
MVYRNWKQPKSKNHNYKNKKSKVKKYNKKASNPKNKPDQVIEVMKIKPGQIIADLGSGGGYYSLRFAKIVGEQGKIYAVDINQENLDYIKKSAKESGLNNIITTITKEETFHLPEKNLDLIFMRNVTHHVPNRTKYFQNLKNFLKTNGKVVIIEYKKRFSFTYQGIFGHNVKKETIIKEMRDAGYLLEKDFSFLPEQHFTIYSKQS